MALMPVGTVIHLELTALVYLAFAVPLAVVAALVTRRVVLSSLGASAAAMAATAALAAHLPFDYWAHANDFIIEPFVHGKIFRQPFEGLLSLLFHVGVPLVLVFVFGRLTGLPRRHR